MSDEKYTSEDDERFSDTDEEEEEPKPRIQIGENIQFKADDSDDEDLDREEITEFQDIAASDDDDEDVDSDAEEDYLQKFDESIRKNIVASFHPELQTHNHEEVSALSTVVRDENGRIVDPLHKTLPFITRYELARVLGERAKQLNAGAQPCVDVEPSLHDGYLIALREYEQKKIPFIIKRPLPNGGCEYWKIQDLESLA